MQASVTMLVLAQLAKGGLNGGAIGRQCGAVAGGLVGLEFVDRSMQGRPVCRECDCDVDTHLAQTGFKSGFVGFDRGFIRGNGGFRRSDCRCIVDLLGGP